MHAVRGVALRYGGGEQVMVFYLWLRYQDPCLGGLPLAIGTKLWTSHMQEKHGAKNKEKMGQCQNKCTQKSKLINVWEWVKHEQHIHYQCHSRAWRFRHTWTWKGALACWNGTFYFSVLFLFHTELCTSTIIMKAKWPKAEAKANVTKCKHLQYVRYLLWVITEEQDSKMFGCTSVSASNDGSVSEVVARAFMLVSSKLVWVTPSSSICTATNIFRSSKPLASCSDLQNRGHRDDECVLASRL